jgi:hypothetical protein
MIRRLKAGDYVIIVLVIAVVTLLFYQYVFSSYQGTEVQITSQGFQRSFDLNEDRVVEVEGPLGITKVVINDGEVWVSDSPCREKICIKMGKKHRVGEEIVCVPNRVVVEVKGERTQVDGVTR